MIAVLIATALLVLPQDTPTITVQLDPQRARVGENVTLRITVLSPSGPRVVEMPQLHSNLQSVGTQDFNEFALLPRGRRNKFTRDIVFIPQAPGQYSIPAIRVVIAGKAHMTLPLLLQVTGDAPAQEPDTRLGDARLIVRMVPETVYVGQQSTLIGEVLLTPDLQLRLTRPPPTMLPRRPISGFKRCRPTPTPRCGSLMASASSCSGSTARISH